VDDHLRDIQGRAVADRVDMRLDRIDECLFVKNAFVEELQN
jgi:hypothetical protein